jgi:hypothetical protein
VAVGLVLAGFGLVFAAVAWTMARPANVTLLCGDMSGRPSELVPPQCTSVRTWFELVDPSQLNAVIGVPFVLAGVALAISAARLAVRLDGTRLIVRGLRTRTVNLAVADVTSETGFGVGPAVGRVRVLTAREAGRRAVRLVVSSLPPAELRLLAGAIDGGRPTGAISGGPPARDVGTLRVAALLREMADNPLELRFQP